MRLVITIWAYSLIITYVTTVFLILIRRNWGSVPYTLLNFVGFIQDALSGAIFRRPIDKTNHGVEKEGNLSDIVKKWKKSETDLLDFSISLAGNGIASIVQDDINSGFTSVPLSTWSTLTVPVTKSGEGILNALKWTFYVVGLIFRLSFLLPLRIALMTTALVWIVTTGIICVSVPGWPRHWTLYCGVTFAKLFNAATGLIVEFEDKHHRPQESGIAVSNHLTANDIMTIYSDCEDIGYTATGQTHGGFIYPLEVFGSKLTPTLWLDRACADERANFQEKMLTYARTPGTYPVLLFPEGFCSNNEVVLQFRKGGFGDDVNVYPMAMTQEARYGDSFWLEDTYLPYLIRILLSWALIIRIRYLPVMRKEPEEDSEMFAERVQMAIARSIGRPSTLYDGGMKRPKDRAKFFEKLQQMIAAQLPTAVFGRCKRSRLCSMSCQSECSHITDTKLAPLIECTSY